MGPPGVHQWRHRCRCSCRRPTSGPRRAAMAFREVRVFEVREVLRLFLRGEGQLTDEFVGLVVAAVRPCRREARGEAWAVLVANHEQLVAWLKNDGLTVVKVHELLA